MASGSGFERDRAVRRREARVELPRLGDGAARQLRTGYPRREPKVVLDSPGRARLAPKRGAVQHQSFESLGGAVDRGAQPCRPGADHDQVDLLPARELAPDPQRARDLARRRATQFAAAGQLDQRKARRIESVDELGRRRIVAALGVAPSERQAIAAGEGQYLHRRPGRARAHDLEADALDPLQGLAPGDEGREHEIAERLVLVEERTHRVAVDRGVSQRLCDDRGDEDRLPRKKVQLPEEARRPVPQYLVARGTKDRDLALEDRDELMALIADAI